MWGCTERITTSRYENIALKDDRIGELWDSGNMEDGRHFLISCNTLNHERHNLYMVVIL